jgi:hypothetical protein
MGSGSLHQWVAWGAVLIVVIVIFIAVAEEKGNKPIAKNKPKSATPGQEEAARDFAIAQAKKVLIPPPGEKRIEAVAPRNGGKFR